MRPGEELTARLIWATRGRCWGFRFLLKGGLSDPLLAYERSFAGDDDKPAMWRRAAGTVALRFPDPLGRRDASGRVIPHEFVVFGDQADEAVTTLAGLLSHASGKVPAPGDKIDLEGHRFEVLEANQQKVFHSR